MVDNYPLDMLPFDSTPQYVFLMVVPWSMLAGFDGLEGNFQSRTDFLGGCAHEDNGADPVRDYRCRNYL